MFIILGAGISGLTLGYELKKAGKPFLILEKSHRAGGWIETETSQDFLFDHGPRSFRTQISGSPALTLVNELNLQDQLIRADPAAKKRLLFHQGRLQTFKPWNGKILKAAWKDLTTGSAKTEDETVEQFFVRRFGNDIATAFGDAMVSGIFAGDYTKLSMKSAFPKFWGWDQTHSGMIRGMFKNRGNKTGIFSFKNGMQTLTDRLAEELKEHIRFNSEVIAMRQSNGSIFLTLGSQELLQAEQVFSTLNPLQLAPLVSQSAAKQLWKIPSASVAVVHLGYKKQLLQQKGFGYLVPKVENQSILGVVWDSCTFPQQNKHPEETRMTVMIGGMRQKNLIDQSPEALQELACTSVQKHLHIDATPDATSIKIARNAIPQYEKGHEQILQNIHALINEQFPQLTLLGSGYNGVSVNDCIANAKSTQIVWG